MLMTGALVIIAKGSSVQPLVAVLFQLTFLLVVLKLSPYGEDDDDVSAFVSSMSILLMTLGAVMLITKADSGSSKLSDADMAFASVFMITLTSSCMAFQFVMTFFSTELGARCRSKVWSTACSPKRAAGIDKSSTNSETRSSAKGTVVVPMDASTAEMQKRSAVELQETRTKFGAESPEYKAKLKEVTTGL